MKRAVLNRNMLISLGISLYLMCRAYWVYGVGYQKSDMLYLITIPLGLSGFVPFACLFPVLPYAMSFVSEYQSGYYRYLMIRQTKKEYIWKKILTVALSGGIMMAAAIGTVYGMAVILGLPVTSDSLADVYANTVWSGFALVWGGKLVLLLKLLLAFLFGVLWSSISLLFTVLIPNRYIAFVSTLILYQILWNLLDSQRWNPIYLLAGDFPYGAVWIPYLIAVCYIAAVTTANRVLMSRRLAHG